MALIKNIKLPNQSEYPVAFFRGTCSTAAATKTKVVDCEYFSVDDLKKGALILVTFDNTNSNTSLGSLTLNVNSTGAKPIKKQYNTSVSNLTATGELIAGQTYFFQYDGTNWVCMNLDYNTTGSDTKNTAGSNQSTSKLFLVGAGSQTTESNGVQTYSNANVYTENGSLYATGLYEGTSRVATLAALQALDSSYTAAAGKVISGIGQVDGKITTVAYTDIASQSQYESYLLWGGKSVSGSVTPIGAAMSESHSANRTAFINGDLVTAEYSSNGGSTWTNYGATATAKSAFFTTSNAFAVGRPNSTTNVVADQSKTRITLTAQDGNNPTGRVYTDPRKMIVLISSPTALELLIETRTGTNFLNDGAWSTFGTYTVSGWSGWSDIPLILGTLGGSSGQTGNIWQLRLTFTVKTVSSSYPKTADVLGVRIFGTNAWSTPSYLATTGHIYSYDINQNATFPASVTATKFVKTGGTSSQFLKADGTVDTNTYATTSQIPTVNNASLTIKGNSTTAATFTANSSSAVNLNFAGSGGTSVTGASGTITISSPTTPNGFANVTVGTTTISADTSVDTLTLVAGTGISLEPDATNDKITITNTVTNTDTKNTAGSTDTASKIFLIGATSQAANPQTYSHDTAYVGTDGLLYSGSKVVATQEYVNGLVANATHYIGDFNASTGAVTNSSTLTQLAEKVGDMFVVSTAGTYAGTALEVGDSIIFKKAVAAGTAPAASDITFVEATVSVSNSGPTLSTSAKTIGTVEGVALTAKVDHVKTSITEKTSYPTGTTASANGGTITVRDVNVNAAGHVTGTQDRTITLSQTLPGSGTLTIKKNGTSVGTFSANASADTSVNITVPTKTSELTNDSGFLTSHQSLAALPKETFKTIKVGTTNVVADTSVDTLTLAGDSFITLTPNATSDTISFAHKADLDATSTAGLFKFTHDEAGHITGTTAVAKADITALGIPGSNTDTKNTAGATASTAKLFIVGAASQDANPTTNTNASVYIDGSVLYSGGKKVATTDQIPTISYPVTSVAGKTGAVTLDSLSIGTKASTSGTATNNVTYNGNGAKGLYFSSAAASTTNVKFTVDNNGFVTGTVTDSGNTDTKNTVGATVSDSTIYLVGPTSTGSSSAQSYANASVYMSAGKLYSDKALVATQTWVTSQGYKTTDTDTKNTTGSNASTAKVYLVGATSQTTGTSGVQTYSNTSVYMQNGKVYSNGAEVLTSHQSLSGYATETWVTNKGYQTAGNVATAINSSLSDLDASFTAGTNQAIAGIGQVNGKITTAKYISIPQGTVTSVTITGTSPITVSSSSAITSSGSRTISHANSGVTAGTYNWGTVNATGHVTAANDVDTAVYWHELT